MDIDEAITKLEQWASVDDDRNYQLQHEYSRKSWEYQGPPSGIHVYSVEVWDPKNGSGYGSGDSYTAAAIEALSRVPAPPQPVGG